MSYALALIGFLGFFITNIYMIIQAVKKKFRKKLLLPPLICFILFIIGASLMPSSTKVAIKTIQISLEIRRQNMISTRQFLYQFLLNHRMPIFQI